MLAAASRPTAVTEALCELLISLFEVPPMDQANACEVHGPCKGRLWLKSCSLGWPNPLWTYKTLAASFSPPASATPTFTPSDVRSALGFGVSPPSLPSNLHSSQVLSPRKPVAV